jgi:hypothetical protein
MEYLLLVMVGPFVTFAGSRGGMRSRHSFRLAVFGGFAGGMMFMVGLMGFADAILFGR